MVLSSSTFLLAAALMAPQGQPSAQPPAQAPPVVQAPPEKAPPQTKGRPSERPPRASKRPPTSSARESSDDSRTSRQGGPVRQELTLSANVQGGYDDNVTGGLGTGAGTLPTAMVSGATANANATLAYFLGNGRRSFRMGATGSLTGYPGNLEDPAPGGTLDVGAMTTVGRNTTFEVSERVGYEPFFNVYSPGASGSLLPPGTSEAVPAAGLFERHSLSTDTLASIEQRWSRWNSLSVSYGYRTQEFIDDDYGDYGSHSARATYRRSLAAGVRARAEYSFQRTDYTDSDFAARPIRVHRIEGGPEFSKALSRRRQLTLSLGAGASHTEAIGSTTGQPYSTWLPTGSVAATLTLSTSVSIEGSYRRDSSLLQGITDEVYTTDTALVSADWMMTDRTSLRLGTTYSNWKTPIASGVSDSFDTYGASLQFQVALTDAVGVTAGYYYYYQRYSNPGALPAGFPAEYNRNAVRVGLAVRVPLVGQPQRARR